MSNVYFINKREHYHYNVFDKIKKLLKKIKYSEIIKKNDIVAVKIHFGESGNTGHLNPLYAALIVDELKKIGAKPFLTDGSTLYKGSRGDAVSHLITAIKHGFDYSVIGAPIILADGLKGNSFVKVEITGSHCKYVEVGAEFYYADSTICLSHVKGHELTGFGGALKNIGMGLASKAGKLKMHSDVKPFIKKKRCILCKKCFSECAVSAISEVEGKADINQEICTGCGTCITICPLKSIIINWDIMPAKMMEIMIEYVSGILKNKKGKSIFINFIEKVSPECDCLGHSDLPIVQDIGILCSTDPVSIDKASVDLVNNSEGLKNTALKSSFNPGEDKFLDLHPGAPWNIQIDYADKIGVGKKKYNLISIK